MALHLVDWLLFGAAAILVGFSKTGLPGTGILVVPLLAIVFGGRASVGIMLPMLIFADVFAVLWYRRHAQWDQVRRLAPWVTAGMLAGALFLYLDARYGGAQDTLSRLIGVLVLVMLAVHLARQRLGDRLAPHSRAGVYATGGSAGFTTMVSNAAGPIMTIYLQSMEMRKQEFMGTAAWFFFIFNLAKLPVYGVLNALNPAKPMMTLAGLRYDLAICPVIVVGVLLGRWLLHRIPQKAFDTAVLVLAAAAALKLVAG